MKASQVETAIKLVLSCRQKQQTGRVTLMKHLYFLQEVKGVDLGLTFELYTWGPFDKRVLAAKDRLVKQGFIEEKKLAEGKGFKISLVKNPNVSSDMALPYSEVEEHIAPSLPKTLEALSTLHKVQRMLPDADRDKVIHTVKTLKPHLQMECLRKNYRHLQGWGWLAPSPQA